MLTIYQAVNGLLLLGASLIIVFVVLFIITIILYWISCIAEDTPFESMLKSWFDKLTLK